MRNLNILATEDEITSPIFSPVKKVKNIVSLSKQPLRTNQMHDEFRRLEALSVYAEVRTNPLYKEFFKNSSEMIRTDYRVSNNPDQRRKGNPVEMRDVRASSSRRGYRLFAPV